MAAPQAASRSRRCRSGTERGTRNAERQRCAGCRSPSTLRGCTCDATSSPSLRSSRPLSPERPLGCTSRIREQVIAAWSLGSPTVVDGDANYTHSRWTNAKGTGLETFAHSYETEPSGPFGYAKGHCFPGSTMDPFAPQYAVPCKGPNAFTWGEQVIAFFEAHPKK